MNEIADDEAELSELLRALREKLRAWNRKHGHPFPGISDGWRTAIRSDLMPACRAFADRVDLLSVLPKANKFAEIGIVSGDFAIKILELNRPEEYHAFDWSFDWVRPENRAALDQHPRVFLHEGNPDQIISLEPPDSYDIIYLNGPKDFSGTQQYMKICLDKLRQDGYLIVNDFTAWDPVQGFPYGVMPAVSKIVNEENLEVVYISLHARGFYNIALRRA